MIYLRENSVYCKIEIIGYEFTKSIYIEDLDWLLIRVEAYDEKFQWTGEGAFLRSSELVELSNWFQELFLSSKNEVSRIDFLENEISFEYDTSIKTLTVILDDNLHPKGKSYNFDTDNEYRLNFILDCSTSIKIIRSFNDLVEMYPKRTMSI